MKGERVMKKTVALLVACCLALSLSFCLSACNNENVDIPTLDDIRTNFYTDDELEGMLHRVKRERLIEAWGEPDRHIDHENEDIWMLDEARALVISYTLFGKVDDAEIED